MSCPGEDLTIKIGSTFVYVVRWETTPIVYKTITGITRAAPAVVTAANHGLTDGWRVALTNVGGMREINATSQPPRKADYHQVTVLTPDTVELNDVNAAGYTAFTSGGVLQYNTPMDIAGFTGRMTIRNRLGGTEIISLTSANNRIAVDNGAKTITLTISATDTAALTATHGVYDLEMVSAGGAVTRILAGKVKFSREVTT